LKEIEELKSKNYNELDSDQKLKVDKEKAYLDELEKLQPIGK